MPTRDESYVVDTGQFVAIDNLAELVNVEAVDADAKHMAIFARKN